MTADVTAPDVASPPFWTLPEGLSEQQVAERVRDGRTNAFEAQTSRSVWDILRTNLLTVFNGLLVVLLAAVLATGRWQNGLFGAVIVVNAGIAVVQEVRAKRTLDRLTLLTALRARVVRAGAVPRSSPWRRRSRREPAPSWSRGPTSCCGGSR